MKPFYHTTHRLALHSRMLLLCLLASLAALPAFAQTTWTGASNFDWNTATNWSAGVPSATTDAIIPSVLPAPIIGAGTSAVAKSVVVSSGALFSILATGSLTINGSAGVGLTNNGTVVNAGSIAIGNTAGPGTSGLVNNGTFTNSATGSISSDRSSDRQLHNAVGGVFTNLGQITIGTIGGSNFGIYNEGTFTHQGGNINAFGNNSAILNESATFTNSASITIRTVTSGGPGRGIHNRGTFYNNTGGNITLDRCAVGVFSETGTFNNAATLTIGASEAIGQFGINNRSTFNNNVGGAITINRSSIIGVYNQTGAFTNAAMITLGAVATVGTYAIYNQATFNNSTCAAHINAVSNSIFFTTGSPAIFANAGTIIENASGNSNITTNTGVVQNLNGGTFTITTNTGLLTTTAYTGLAIAPAPALTINTGQTATLTASGAVSYLWSTGETTNAISTSVAGPYSVTGTIGGCTSVTSVMLTVNPPVCGTLVVSPLSTSICDGTSMMFTASGGTNYLWSTGETTAVISVSVGGPYSVTATTPYCPASVATVALTVQPLINIITQPVAGSSVCTGASVTAFVNVTGIPTGYQWYRNGNPIAGQTSATLSLPATVLSDAGSYAVVVTGACNSLTSTAFTLTVSPFPTPTLFVSGTLTCATTSMTLTATGGTTYTFSGPGGFTQSGSGNTASVSTPGTYTVNVANASGCSSQTTVVISQDITSPALTLTTASSACAGQPITLLATAGLTNYVFSGPGAFVGSGNSRTVTGLSAGLYSFTVTATQVSNGCSSWATASAMVNATSGAPTLTALSRTVLSTTTPLSLLPFVQVTTGNTLSFSVTSGLLNPPNANVSTAGVLSFWVTQVNGNCVSPTLPFSLTVVPTTSATAGASPTVCRKSNVVLSVTATGINLSYSWLEDNGNGKLRELTGSNASSTNSLTLTNVQQSSDYYCRVTGTYGTVLVGPIKLTVNRTCTARVGVEEPAALGVVLAPNPLENGLLRATVRGAGGHPLTVQLYDIGGYVIGQQSWEQAEAAQLIEWNVATQPAGLYVLRAVSQGQQQTVKAIKP